MLSGYGIPLTWPDTPKTISEYGHRDSTKSRRPLLRRQSQVTLNPQPRVAYHDQLKDLTGRAVDLDYLIVQVHETPRGLIQVKTTGLIHFQWAIQLFQASLKILALGSLITLSQTLSRTRLQEQLPMMPITGNPYSDLLHAAPVEVTIPVGAAVKLAARATISAAAVAMLVAPVLNSVGAVAFLAPQVSLRLLLLPLLRRYRKSSLVDAIASIAVLKSPGHTFSVVSVAEYHVRRNSWHVLLCSGDPNP